MSARQDMAMRSLDSAWDRARWGALPQDGNRYEVIEGVLYRSTSPSAFHQWIVGQIYTVLRAQLDGPGVASTFLAPLGVFMPGCDPVQPDLIVVRREDLGIVRARIEGVPALLVEVLSPSNAGTDTDVKRHAYARAGVPEYWIVRPAQRDMLLYSQPDRALGDYAQTTHVDRDGEVASPTLPFRVPVASFFADAPSTEL